MQHLRSFACWATIAVLAGCGADDASSGSDQDAQGEMRVYRELCSDGLIETRSLGWSEPSPLGFSAAELFAALGAERRTTFTSADGTSTELSVGLDAADASVDFASSRFGAAPAGTTIADPFGAGNPLIDPGCWDMLSIEATLAFATADGAFAEAWPVRLLAWDLTGATGGVARVDLTTLEGDYRATSRDPSDPDELVLQARLAFTPTKWSGAIQGVAITHLSGGIDQGELFDIGRYQTE